MCLDRGNKEFGLVFMALKKCRECGKAVSDTAKSCPNCGAELKMGLIDTVVVTLGIITAPFWLSLLYVLVQDDSSNIQPSSSPPAESSIPVAPMQPAPVKLSFDSDKICRAAIATVMVKDPAIIEVYSHAAGMIFVFYKRPSDNKLHQFRCRLSDGVVRWNFVGDKLLVKEDDLELRHAMSGDALQIIDTGEDGRVKVREFTHQDLQ